MIFLKPQVKLGAFLFVELYFLNYVFAHQNRTI